MIKYIALIALFSLFIFCQLFAQEAKSLQKQKGFLSINEIGVMVTNESALYAGTNAQALSFHSFNAYQVVPSFAFGLGLGVDSYPDRLIMPLTVGISGNILKKNITPFYKILVGHGYNLSKNLSNNNNWGGTDINFQGGLVVNPSVGLKVYIADSKAFILQLGYKHQESFIEQTVRGGSNFRQEVTFQRLIFSLGFSF